MVVRQKPVKKEVVLKSAATGKPLEETAVSISFKTDRQRMFEATLPKRKLRIDEVTPLTTEEVKLFDPTSTQSKQSALVSEPTSDRVSVIRK